MPSTKGPKRFNAWYLLLLAILPAIAFAMHFRGVMVLGWDTEPPMRPDLYLANAFSAWKWSAYLGQSNVFALSSAPFALIYRGLALAVGLEWCDKILLTVLFVLPAFTMYYCARRVIGTGGWLAFAAAWCYALSPLLFVRYYIPIMTVQLTYALLPLLVNVWVDLFQNGASARRLLNVALVEIAYLPCGINLAYWLVPHLTAFVYVMLCSWTRPEVETVYGKSRVAWRAILVTAAVNAFWIVPVVLFGLAAGATIEHESITRAYTAGVVADVAQNSALTYTLRMSSGSQTSAGDPNGTFWTYAPALQNGLIAAPYYLWILLAVAAIAFRPRDRRVTVLGVLLCFAIFVMKGESAPFQFVLEMFYRIPLLGTIFRNGNDKLLPMAGFAFALLAPLGFSAALRRFARKPVAQYGFLAAILLMAFPYWTGQMFMARPAGPTLASKPPEQAFAFTRALDGVDSRILFTPVDENPQLLSTSWGFYGPTIYGGMTAASVISNPASTLNVPGVDFITTAIYRAIETQDYATFRTLTKIASIGYVMVAHDVETSYYGGRPAPTVDDFLGHAPGASLVMTSGPYALWHMNWVAPLTRGLVTRHVAGYQTELPKALAVADRCGEGVAIVPFARKAPCQIRDGVISPNPESTPESYPASVALTGGRLSVVRAGESSARAGVALGPGTIAARIANVTVIGAPVPMELQPCGSYWIESFAASGAPVPLPMTYAMPATDGAYVPVPTPLKKLQLLTLDVLPSGLGASVTLDESENEAYLVEAGTLARFQKSLIFSPMPQRGQMLAFGAAEPQMIPRAFASAMSVTPIALTGSRRFVAPPDARGCVGSGVPLLRVDAPTIPATIALEPGRLVIRRNDTMSLTSVGPLPAGAQLARIVDDVIGTEGYDVALPTGGPVFVHLYRQRRVERLPFPDMAHETDNTLANLDRAAGSTVIRSVNKADRWARIDLPSWCTVDCVVRARVAALFGTFGMRIVEAESGTVLASQMGTRKPVIAMEYKPRPGVRYQLYLYTNPGEEYSQSALEVARVDLAQVVPMGAMSFQIPRIAPGSANEQKSVEVVRHADRPPLDALVLDTEFDPFWTTLLMTDRWPYVEFPPHVPADGYKNAWLVSPNDPGRPTAPFYLLDVVAIALLALAGVVLASLGVRALRN